MLKRINKELKDFDEKKYKNLMSNNVIKFFDNLTAELYIINDNNRDTHHIQIVYNKNNKILLDLFLPLQYPFKPYNIYNHHFLNSNMNNSNISYSRYLGNTSTLIDKYDNTVLLFFYNIQYGKSRFLNLNKHSCFCCSSITCAYNWGPSCTINTILLEYLETDFIIKYCKKYNNKKITHIYTELFALYFNKLPDDVIKIIFGFLC